MESHDGGVLVALALACAAWSVAGPLPAAAEVVLDGTTGPAGALPGPADFTIPAELGQRAGGNLFHSFQVFNLAHPESATFTGPAGIANVVSRVTGGAPSSIDGLLRSEVPGADFWFLNPAGVVFGPNARLDVPGSFHVSTADELRFEDGARFSAVDPTASSLTVAAPEAFGFLGAEPGGIIVDQGILEVPPGEVLSLVGGDIDVNGGSVALLGAEGGTIRFTALAGPGAATVTGDVQVTPGSGGDVHVSGLALIDASGDGSGRIQIRANRFVLENSLVLADNTGNQNSAGGVDVEANVVQITGLATLQSSARGDGRAGSVTVRAREVHVIGDEGQVAKIASDSVQGASGDAGEVTVSADMVTIRNNGAIGSAVFGEGDGGTVTVEAKQLKIANELPTIFSTGIVTSSQPGSSGDTGAITVTADELEISGTGGNAVIASSTRNFRNGGTITVRADHLVLSGPDNGIASFALLGATGNAGTISVISDAVKVDGAVITTSTLFGTPSDAGSVTVRAGEINLTGGGQISSDAFGFGNGGDIFVTATRSLEISGQDAGGSPSGVFAGAVDAFFEELGIKIGGDGGSGTVRITSPVVILADGGQIASSSSHDGPAGDLFIDISKRLKLDNASIVTEAIFAGGGRINIQVGKLIDLRDSEISTSVVANTGDAGDITIDPRFVVLDNSSVIADAVGGQGGNIRIVAENFIASPDSVVRASSELGIDGTVEIAAPEVDLTGRLAVLEGAFLDAASQLRERCGERRGGGAGSFTGMGRGGVGVGPDAPLPGFYAGLVGGAGPDAAAASAGRGRAVGIETTAPSRVELVLSCGGRG